MTYRALRTLNTVRGFIRAGEKVPSDYLRVDEALAKGWIEEVNESFFSSADSSMARPSSSKSETVESLTKLSLREFLDPVSAKKLAKFELRLLSDVAGYDEDDLSGMGITKKKARDLLKAFNRAVDRSSNEEGSTKGEQDEVLSDDGVDTQKEATATA